ncbi:MAG: 3-deoxy-D-manno-octulosonic acid transferase [Chitinophagia bacterium]|nr:3-deoxy-D-manno-octulosonic acid transferase [Chitinophagia bacterium]
MSKLFYELFLLLYAIAFRIAALFNTKARLGLQGRKNIFSTIQANLPPSSNQVVWMHCSSVGEFEQGRPLVESLKKNYPSISITITFFSASGYEATKNYEGADQIYYLPFDGASNAKKMVELLNPSLVIWIKYEFWYHYLHELKSRKIPVLLISGIFRNSQPFFKWYGSLWKEMLASFTYFFVQNESSLKLLSSIAINNNVIITGDTRFDRVIEIAEKFEPISIIEKYCKNNRVIVAGSTWEEDETELIHYIKANPAIKFIIAPHETDQGNIQQMMKVFPNALLYTDLTNALVEQREINNLLIIDNVGMLSRLYHYASITYVGGGFGADGVHNVLEAAVYGKPVIFGPEYKKYAEAIGLVESGGGIPIKNALELESVLNLLWEQEDVLKKKGIASKKFVFANAGASKKIIQFVQENRLLIN